MLFGVVRGVGRGMGVLDGGGEWRSSKKGRLEGGSKCGHPIVTNGLSEGAATRLF